MEHRVSVLVIWIDIVGRVANAIRIRILSLVVAPVVPDVARGGVPAVRVLQRHGRIPSVIGAASQGGILLVALELIQPYARSRRVEQLKPEIAALDGVVRHAVIRRFVELQAIISAGDVVTCNVVRRAAEPDVYHVIGGGVAGDDVIRSVDPDARAGTDISLVTGYVIE